jgi:hypothetical protein
MGEPGRERVGQGGGYGPGGEQGVFYGYERELYDLG